MHTNLRLCAGGRWVGLLGLLALMGGSLPVSAASLRLEPSTLAPGQCLQKVWVPGIRHLKLPVMVCRRTPQQIAALTKTKAKPDPKLLLAVQLQANRLADSRLPSQMLAMQQRLDRKPSRSLRDDYFVALQMEPYIGCQLQTESFAKERSAFRNPCHGNGFDSNGRPLGKFTLYPQFFLQIPPYRWQGETLVIGELPSQIPWMMYDMRVLDGQAPRETQLINAASWGDIPRLDALVHDKRTPVDINAAPDYLSGTTALMAAVSKDQLAAVRWLLTNGANPNTVTKYGTTALKVAEIIGDEAVTSELKKYGARTKPEKH